MEYVSEGGEMEKYIKVGPIEMYDQTDFATRLIIVQNHLQSSSTSLEKKAVTYGHFGWALPTSREYTLYLWYKWCPLGLCNMVTSP